MNFILIISFEKLLYPIIITDENLIKANTPLDQYVFSPLLKNDSTFFNIDKTDKAVIDFMFINCRPCIEKLDHLHELGKYKKVYIIVNWKIDSYNDYVKFYTNDKNKLKNTIFLYDTSGIFTEQFGVNLYPSEVILKDNSIIARDEGFPKYAKKEYISIRKELLE